MEPQHRFLRALQRLPVDRTPIWIMRQAGRYLPEYRATRERAGSFLTLCKTPELACEVTLQPLDRFDLDAAILFSDILTIPDAMGLGLELIENQGPVFARTVRSRAEVDALPMPDPARDLRYVTDAVSLIRRELGGRVPLIGFAGSPWTLACYMIEGRGSRDFASAKAMAYGEPAAMQGLMDKLVAATTAYLNAQIEAGAQAIQIFDTWGGNLTTDGYKRWSLEPMQRIVDGLKREHDGQKIPVILFTKGAGNWLELIADTGCDAVGLDWTIDPMLARARIGNRVALQGNLDPGVLTAPADAVCDEARRVLDAFGPAPGHVFNLGHGITPQIDPETVGALVDAVHAHTARTDG